MFGDGERCHHGTAGFCWDCSDEDAYLVGKPTMNPRAIAITAARDQYAAQCNAAFMILGINRGGSTVEAELSDAEEKCRWALKRASSAYLVAKRLAMEIPEAEI